MKVAGPEYAESLLSKALPAWKAMQAMQAMGLGGKARGVEYQPCPRHPDVPVEHAKDGGCGVCGKPLAVVYRSEDGAPIMRVESKHAGTFPAPGTGGGPAPFGPEECGKHESPEAEKMTVHRLDPLCCVCSCGKWSAWDGMDARAVRTSWERHVAEAQAAVLDAGEDDQTEKAHARAAVAHLGDPCKYCGVAFEAVAAGPCPARVAASVKDAITPRFDASGFPIDPAEREAAVRAAGLPEWVKSGFALMRKHVDAVYCDLGGPGVGHAAAEGICGRCGYDKRLGARSPTAACMNCGGLLKEHNRDCRLPLPDAATPTTGGGGETLASQVDRLATFITSEVSGEPSRNEGAIDTAIRVMRNAMTTTRLLREEVTSLREEVTRLETLLVLRTEAAVAQTVRERAWLLAARVRVLAWCLDQGCSGDATECPCDAAAHEHGKGCAGYVERLVTYAEDGSMFLGPPPHTHDDACRPSGHALSAPTEWRCSDGVTRAPEEGAPAARRKPTRDRMEIVRDYNAAVELLRSREGMDRRWKHKATGTLVRECGMVVLEASAQVAICYRENDLSNPTLPPWAREWREFLDRFEPVPDEPEQPIVCAECAYHAEGITVAFGAGKWKLRAKGEGFVPVCPECVKKGKA